MEIAVSCVHTYEIKVYTRIIPCTSCFSFKSSAMKTESQIIEA